MELIFERSRPGCKGVSMPAKDVPVEVELDPGFLRKKDAELPDVSQVPVSDALSCTCEMLADWWVAHPEIIRMRAAVRMMFVLLIRGVIDIRE